MRDKFKDIVADTDGDYEAIAEHYMEIYAGTSLTEDQVWEEMICDSLADMNIFSKSKSRAEAAEVMSTAIPAIQQAVSETKGEATKTDAQVEGKASRDLYTATNEFIRDVPAKDRSAFARSLANKTTGMADGEIRTIYVAGYIFKADGYMSGTILAPYNEKTKKLLEAGKNERNSINKDTEIASVWTDTIRDADGGIGGNSSISRRGRGSATDDRLLGASSGRDSTGDNERVWSSARTEEENHEIVNKAREMFGLEPVDYGKQGKASRELDLDYDENIEATKTLTNRDILVNALENVTQSQDELDKLREYKKNIEQLNKKTFVLGKLKEEIKAMSFGKGQRDIALSQNQPQQQKASPGIDCRERLSFLEDIMDKASLLEFLSERNLQLHSEYLENCRMRLSILEKSGYSIGGKSYPELFRARLGGARDEILPFAREVYLHELYFDSFGMVGECAECLKSSYRSVAGFLYELECAAMAADGGFLLVTRGKSGVSISHNTGITSRLCAEPRLAIDLAEHAYFLDYGFDKLSYVRAALSRLRLSKLNN
ncbi:MAG: hypothetical protein IKA67_04160 [Clostridia bacterium]|nr:hypothetical protein [Clostridia bacterium]